MASQSLLTSNPVADRPVAPTTVDCYEFWDRIFRRAGVLDYTEGFYDGDPTVPYEEAQQRQFDYLLDEAGCREGSRILDIGCGNGSLLEAVRRRGGLGVGITISPHQVEFNRKRGLDVRLLNYANLDEAYHGRFDAVIANGSIEHFVQPTDAAAGRTDAIYGNLFSLVHAAIDPTSSVQRFVNTTIHFDRFVMPPEEARRSPWSYRWFSDKFHFALLMRGFGGYYPAPGQFERCAASYFRLVHQRDATQDYHLTSEDWLRHGMRSLINPAQWGRLLPFAARRPLHAASMMFQLVGSQSWNWQFRSETPPMKHLWQTWQRKPGPSGGLSASDETLHSKPEAAYA